MRKKRSRGLGFGFRERHGSIARKRTVLWSVSDSRVVVGCRQWVVLPASAWGFIVGPELDSQLMAVLLLLSCYKRSTSHYLPSLEGGGWSARSPPVDMLVVE
jgi:hypothetical protein